MTFKEYIMLAYSYIGKEIKGFGEVKAITIYGSCKYGDKISFCFKDDNGWSETSVSDCIPVESKEGDIDG